MKMLKKLIVIILAFTIILTFFSGCKDKDKDKDPKKPSIHTALMNYQQTKKKKSVIEAGIKFSMYPSADDPLIFGQIINGVRIQNDNKYYLDGRLESYEVSDNLIATINSLATLMQSQSPIDQDFIDYLKNETFFAGRLGYSENTYNGKGDYCKTNQTPDYLLNGQPLWYVIDQTSINNLQNNMGFSGDINFKDFLMYSTVVNLEPSAGWIKNDAATSKFNKEIQAYEYDLTINGSKIKSFILDSIANAADNFDEEQHSENLLLYSQIMPLFQNWIKTPNSQVKARLDKNGKLLSLSQTINIYIDIVVKEFWDIAELVLPEENKKMLPLIKWALSDMFVSATGETGIWSVRIQLTTDEQFYYDDESVNLDNVDSDLFLPSTEENSDRETIIIEARES